MTTPRTFSLGGDLTVGRLGYGTMWLTGPGVWGEPADRPNALRVLRAAVEQGVTFIDTADSYGPMVTERLVADALHPYPEGVVVATKVGNARPGPGVFVPVGHPAYLRQQTELSLRELRTERIDLMQLHRVDPAVPLAEQVGTLAELKKEGKIRHIGLSEVTVAQLKEAQTITEIASVQNLYNLVTRQSQDVLEYATAQNIAFIPWFPMAMGKLAQPGSPVTDIAAELHTTPAQLALAWLLHISPVVLPIPGTTSVDHLTENLRATDLTLTETDVTRLTALA
ncbi:aldo/keto reductase [Streptomyces sp. NPDC004539]|uniref:aldo/keto reductase n=1 Tax=Streptomyces sp. NPDC004539 TaxID=3154280 RepID=UPI0033ABC913